MAVMRLCSWLTTSTTCWTMRILWRFPLYHCCGNQIYQCRLWHTQPKCVSPLNVVTRSNGKQRLILDLRHVNQFLMVPSFLMDFLNLLTDLADLDDLMLSLDLASAYHQVDMDPRYYTFLGFQWEGELYVFRVLPFGLASAPWCFTKIMRTISLYLRFRGVRL